MAVRDVRTHRIANVTLLAALVPSAAWLIWQGVGPAAQAIGSSLLGLGLCTLVLLPGFLAGRRLGAGDVKFAAVCGGVLGPLGSVTMLLMAMLVQGLLSVLVLLTRRPDARRTRLPAGPALAAGFIITLIATSIRSGSWEGTLG